MAEQMQVMVAVVVDLGVDAVDAFRRYESLILPLLEQHRGRLERRVRDTTGLFELHLVSFEDNDAFESFMNDSRRVAHRELLDGLDVRQRVLKVGDVPLRESFP